MSLQTKLSDLIGKKVADARYAGAVAKVHCRGQALADVCLGTLGRELSDPMISDSLFSLESISKVVCTAPLVLALSEDGILDLDKPLGTWLEEFRHDGKEKITPRQILSHSSGLPDTDDISFDASADPDKLWKTILRQSLLFQPGLRVHYSDLGYLVLGRAIEKVTRETLDRLARERLWGPLGMTDTQFNPPSNLIGRLTSNRGIQGRCIDPVDQALGGVVGCDGVFSTAADLVRFGRMILGEGRIEGKRILTAESVRELTRDQTPFALSDDEVSHDFEYLFSARKALGWELPGGRYCHGGSFFSDRAFGKVGGTGTFLWIDPQQDLIAVYLTNHGHPIPFGSTAWSEMIDGVGAKEFFDIVNGK